MRANNTRDIQNNSFLLSFKEKGETFSPILQTNKNEKNISISDNMSLKNFPQATKRYNIPLKFLLESRKMKYK